MSGTHRYYPVNLDIRDRRCLVVGGGGVGTRKVEGLRACAARVTLVSLRISDRLRPLAADGRIEWRDREYRTDDLDGMFLVIGATDDPDLNRRIHADAASRNMLCNIADRPEVCNFILPAVVRRGDLILAVSTSGRSPAFAKKLRKELEARFGPEYALFLDLMGAVRAKLLAEEHAPEAHKPLFEALIDRDLLGLLKAGDMPAVDLVLADELGPGFRYADLMGAGGGERGPLP
jgi:precorrin-2 dehydrogenase / sirohydrochlorin ferrochelatase